MDIYIYIYISRTEVTKNVDNTVLLYYFVSTVAHEGKKWRYRVHPRIGHVDLSGGWGGGGCRGTTALLILLPRRWMLVDFQRCAPIPLLPVKRPATPVHEAVWAPGSAWMGMENVALIGIRSPHCPARNESLYRLSYPGSPVSKPEDMVKDLTHLRQ